MKERKYQVKENRKKENIDKKKENKQKISSKNKVRDTRRKRLHFISIKTIYFNVIEYLLPDCVPKSLQPI